MNRCNTGNVMCKWRMQECSLELLFFCFVFSLNIGQVPRFAILLIMHGGPLAVLQTHVQVLKHIQVILCIRQNMHSNINL